MTVSVTLVSGQSAVVGVASSREAYEIEVSSGVPGPAGVSIDSANVVGGMLNITLSNSAVINAGSVMATANTGTITFTGDTIGEFSNGAVNIQGGNNTWSFEANGSITFPDGSVQDTAYTGSGGNTTVDFTAVSSHILPSANLTYNLGSPTKKWHSLYVGTGSIYIGDAKLSIENDKLNSSIGFATDNLSIGNVDITVNGNGALVSSGGFVGAIANTGNISFSNTTLYTPNGATTNSTLTIQTHGYSSASPAGYYAHSWVYGSNGSLTFPDGTVQMTAFTGPENVFNQSLNTTDGVRFANVTSSTLTSGIDEALSLQAQFRPSVSADCYLATTDQFVAWTEFNDDITVVQPGWTVDIDGTTYVVDSVDSSVGFMYKINVIGATFNVGSTYTFYDDNNPALNTMVLQTGGTLTVPGDILIGNGAGSIKGSSGFAGLYSNTTFEFDGVDVTSNNLTRAFNQGNVAITTDTSNNNHTWTFDSVGNLTFPGNILPITDNLQDIGTPSARVRHIYVGPGSVTIGNSVITESITGKLVLPGVTRATTLYADEVEDTNDQTHSFNSTPSVIVDAYEYGVRAGVETPPGSYVSAEYSVGRLDDDGYIDEIGIVSQGTWTQAIADANRRNPMYVYVGSDINEPFNPTNWINVPFIVRSKANDVEYEFSGGGADLGDFTIDGDVLEADQMTIKTNDGDINVNSDANFNLRTSGGDTVWSFNGAGVLTLPAGGDIQDSTGSSVLGGGSVDTGNVVFDGNQLYVGGVGFLNFDDNNQAVIGTNGSYPLVVSLNEGDKTWEFDPTGDFYMPDGGAIRFNYGYIDQDPDRDNEALRVSGGNGVTIKADEDGKTWRFNNDGTITFPDDTVQTTAYTGQANGGSTVARQDTAPTASNGTLWYNTIEGRTYIKYNDQWVDASPTVLAPPDTNPTVESITFNDGTILTSATAIGDRLVNGTFALILNSNGTLTAPDDVVVGATGGRFIQDCGDGTTSIRWINIDQGIDSTEMIRAYTGNGDVERATVKMNWLDDDRSGLTITAFDNSSQVSEYSWDFQGDGGLKFPDTSVQRSAYRSGQQTVNVNAASTSTAIELTALTGTVIVIQPEAGYTATGEYHNITLPATEDIALGTRITVINQYDGTAAVSGWPGPGYELLPYQSMDLVYYYDPDLPGNLWWVVGTFSW